VPVDGLPYRFCHSAQIQTARATVAVPSKVGGTIHDYVPFYFGYLSPMMFQLKTGWVQGYDEGQEPLIYFVSSAQAVVSAGIPFVYTDGHCLARFTAWFDNLAELDQVDWTVVNRRYWRDDINDMDRQRKKQAEFLVYRYCPWTLIDEIVVINTRIQQRVESIQVGFSPPQRKIVRVVREWYY
jgi:hypothetical protein